MIDAHHEIYWKQYLVVRNKHFSLSLGTSTVASKYEELECLYAAVGKVIYEGLTNYEKATSNTNPTQLFGKFFISFFSSLYLFHSTLLCYFTVIKKKKKKISHLPLLFL